MATPSVDLVRLVEAAAAASGVDASLLKGLVERESAWNPWAVSPAGAVGLTQVMPWWTKSEAGRALTGLRSQDDLLDPGKNLMAGARILASELARFGGSVPLALMAYNAGSPAVSKAVAKVGQDPQQVEILVPAEARAYWRAVMIWASSWGGKISRAEASVRVKTGEITSEILNFAKSQAGKSTLFFFVMFGLAAVLIAGGRRAG